MSDLNMTDTDCTSLYDGDLCIFIHRLAEISAILGFPYDAAYDLKAGHFSWNRGAVVLHAGPFHSTLTVALARLIENGDVVSTDPDNATLARLSEFCTRCSIRLSTIVTNQDIDESDYIDESGIPLHGVDLPSIYGSALVYNVTAAWDDAGIVYRFYSSGGGGAMMMIRDGDRYQEAQAIADVERRRLEPDALADYDAVRFRADDAHEFCERPMRPAPEVRAIVTRLQALWPRRPRE
jgi:hypothetical protein